MCVTMCVCVCVCVCMCVCVCVCTYIYIYTVYIYRWGGGAWCAARGQVYKISDKAAGIGGKILSNFGEFK
jgi:hypothetical protein